MLNDTNDFFVLLREKNWDGMAEWMLACIDIAPSTQDEHSGKPIELDGFILLPIFQMQHTEAAQALLRNPDVRTLFSSTKVLHFKWVTKLAKEDPKAFFWALEQGWGEIVSARPSSMKAYELMRCHDIICRHFVETVTGKNIAVENQPAQTAAVERMQNIWDTWLRRATKRNPMINVYLFKPTKDELVSLATCGKNVGLRPYFWEQLEVQYPGVCANREFCKSLYEGTTQWSSEQDFNLLRQCLGMDPIAVESLPLPAAFDEEAP